MTVLTISTRKYVKGVKVTTPVQRIELGATENKVLFMAETIKEEVMRGSEAQQLKNIKKLRKMYNKFVSILVAGVGTGLFVPLTASAQETGTPSPILPAPDTAPIEITPPVVMEWGITLATIVVAAGAGLSISLLAAAGIYRMFRKRREASEWTTDIIKGLVQVLIAIPTVYALFYLAQLIFQSLPALSGL